MIISQDIKSKMQYRADFIISSLGMVITNIAGYISFWLIYQNFSSINGWSYYEIQFLYGFSLLAISPAQLLFDNLWNLSKHVNDGKFIAYCFRPINLFFYYVAETFDLKGISQVILGLLVLISSWSKLGIPVSVGNILLFLVVLLTSSLVMCAILTFASGTSFWFIQSHYIVMFFCQFKDYAKYPITIFNSVLRFLFSFIIPMGFIAYYPSLFFVHTSEISIITYLSPLFGVAFFYLAYKFWMYGAKKYSGTGS